MPAKQANQYGGNREIEHVVSWGQRTFGKKGQDKNLQGIRRDSQDHPCLKTPARRIVGHLTDIVRTLNGVMLPV